MYLNISNIDNDKYGYARLGKIIQETDSLLFDKLILDFSSCTFFEANMCAALEVVLSLIRNNIVEIQLVGLHESIKRILQKNHFLEYWRIPSIEDTNETVLPFQRFKSTEQTFFYLYLQQFMRRRGLPVMSNLLKKYFIESLLELFSNAAEHSLSASGIFVCGQYFPNKKRLDFSIADAGIGFRGNVRRRFQNDNISSVAALEWSLRDGNTTRTGVVGGLGLKLLRDFVKFNKGKLQIISRFAYYEYENDSDSFEKMDYEFPGTCVNLEVNTSDSNSYCLKSEKRN